MPSIAINRLVKKNKFGCTTWFIPLDNLHRIDIHETTNGTYIIDFLELGVLWNSTKVSFTSNNHIIDVLDETMDRVANYFRNAEQWNVPEDVLLRDKAKVMALAFNQFS